MITCAYAIILSYFMKIATICIFKREDEEVGPLPNCQEIKDIVCVDEADQT